eukprot:scaffold557915_cov29-Prasinocladus_malaysianus.AAC.1
MAPLSEVGCQTEASLIAGPAVPCEAPTEGDETAQVYRAYFAYLLCKSRRSNQSAELGWYI